MSFYNAINNALSHLKSDKPLEKLADNLNSISDNMSDSFKNDLTLFKFSDNMNLEAKHIFQSLENRMNNASSHLKSNKPLEKAVDRLNSISDNISDSFKNDLTLLKFSDPANLETNHIFQSLENRMNNAIHIDDQATLGAIPFSYQTIAPEPTKAISISANLDARFEKRSSAELPISVPFYSAQGIEFHVHLDFVPVSIPHNAPAETSQAWKVSVNSIVGNDTSFQIAGELLCKTITFNTNGMPNIDPDMVLSIDQLYGSKENFKEVFGNHSFGVNNDIMIDLGSMNKKDGLTCFAGPTKPYRLKYDGHTFGELESVQLSSKGKLTGTYTNGVQKDLFSVQLAK